MGRPSVLYDVASLFMAHFTIRPFERSSEQSVVQKRRPDQFTQRDRISKTLRPYNVSLYYITKGVFVHRGAPRRGGLLINIINKICM